MGEGPRRRMWAAKKKTHPGVPLGRALVGGFSRRRELRSQGRDDSLGYFTSMLRALLTGTFFASVSVSTPFSSFAPLVSVSMSCGSS